MSGLLYGCIKEKKNYSLAYLGPTKPNPCLFLASSVERQLMGHSNRVTIVLTIEIGSTSSHQLHRARGSGCLSLIHQYFYAYICDTMDGNFAPPPSNLFRPDCSIFNTTLSFLILGHQQTLRGST